MNLLTEAAPKTVSIAGVEVPIHWDFRTSIRFEQLMEEDLPDEEKLAQALALYYPQIPFSLEEAVEKLLWFYAAGKEDTAQTGETGRSEPRIYSYRYDDEYIYAAFLDQYGIDLQEADLHWWKFKAMFQGLKSDNRIVEIMGYRAMEIPSKMNREQKEFYRKMKKQYAIPLPKSEREKLSAIEEALLHGGDVSKLL